MAFTSKQIEVTFQLGEGAFGEDGTDTVKLTGLRVSANIVKMGGDSKGMCRLRIFGMPLQLMDKLSTLGLKYQAERRNVLLVSAGDTSTNLGMVFSGTIQEAWADLQSAPQASFHVSATAGLYEALKPVPAVSYPGAADVATIIASVANQMGRTFENNGVNVTLAKPYLKGTAWDQAQKVARDAGIEIIDDNGAIAIWPKGGSRDGLIPLISPATGMVGYPTYTSKGIIVRTLFSPSSIGFGKKVLVDCLQKPACGEWVIFSLVHDLDALVPGGSWFTSFEAVRPDVAVTH